MKDWAVKYWLEHGMPKDKINLGLATYGRTFELADPDIVFVGAQAVGPGAPGTYTREKGILAYFEVRVFLDSMSSITKVV